MAIVFEDLQTPQGVKHLDEYLATRTYISGSQPSRDDLVVYSALRGAPPTSAVNASRWYTHVSHLLASSFPGESVGVTVPTAAAAPAAPAAKAAEDDDDMDLFGEETEEEKAAAAQRAASSKASSKKKESGKSSVLLDVKPWDDETDMKKLEEAVRAVEMPGLFWGASKLVPVGYGIKKLQIMMTIEDDLVSVDELIEDRLTEGPAAEFVQSCDIVAFNKI